MSLRSNRLVWRRCGRSEQGAATAEVTQAPWQMKPFGRLELFRALRKGSRVEVLLVGFPETAECRFRRESWRCR